MKRDFTLRSVVLQHPARRAEGVYDALFRDGRLAVLHPAPPETIPRLYLTPGFRDAHLHLLHLGLGRRRLDLSATTSLEEALSAVATFSREHGSTGVIWGVGWDESRWREQRAPVREEIDHWVPDRPVIMRRVCGHLAILNSPALGQARERWGDLAPSGRLVEERAMELSSLWPESPEERSDALREAQSRAFDLGVTRVGEMGSSGAAETYLQLEERGELRLQVDLFLPSSMITRAIEWREGGRFGGEHLRLGGIKLYADGSVGARTAAFLEPYADRQGRGTLLHPDHALYETLERCRRSDLRVAIHAIGDAALGQVVRQLERLAEAMGPLAPGWASLEHAELLSGEMLDRIERLRVRLSLQPNFVAQWGQPGELYERALGHERWRRMNPFREIRDREIPVVFGSDGMPMNPALGLKGAVHHPVPEHRLSAEDALCVYLGGRDTVPGLWGPEDWWQPGCDGAVLYGSDPVGLCDGEASRLPVLGVLWQGEWIRSPDEELARSGVFHAD